MEWTKPSPADVQSAVRAYLAVAYDGVPVPKAVTGRIETLIATGDDLYQAAVFETDKSTNPPIRYLLRLGNHIYPHMKLVIERSPDGQGALFRADTHDQHIRPKPGTRDADAFTMLMVQNQAIAGRIEDEWARVGVPTFKTFLQQDLARRRNTALQK